MALPSNVGKGTVTGRFIDAFGANIAGTITFTPSPRRLLNATAAPSPVTILPKPVTVALVDGTFVQQLVATDDPDNNPQDWTYAVSFNLTDAKADSFNIEVKEGQTVDLTTVAPVATGNGTMIIRGAGVPDVEGGTDGQVLVLVDGEPTWGDAPGGSTSWDELTDKPSTFPPDTHTHSVANVTGLQAALDSKQASGSYAAASHTHSVANVTGLQAALDSKQASGSYAAASHTHAVADVTGLQTALDGKAASSHTHTIANVTGLQAAIDAAAASGGSSTGSRSRRIFAQQMASIKPPVGAALGINEWVAPPANVISAAAPTEGQLLGQPIRIGANKVLTQIGVGVTTAGSATSKVRLGILSFHPGHSVDPYTLVDAGQVDASTTGWKTVNISLPVGIGQVIIPVAVVQGVGGGTAPQLRLQTAGNDAQLMLGGPGTDPSLQSSNGYGTWAYTHGQGALNDVYGGGSTLRSALPAPRIFIRSENGALPSLVANPRQMTRLPENVRLRGANCTVRYSHDQAWGVSWNWNWWKDQIDDAKAIGVNAIRVMGGQGAVPGTSLSTYLSHWTQMADYIQAQGMYFYPALAGTHPVSGGSLIAGHQDTILATAALLEPYTNVIAFDVYNEGGNSVAADMPALRGLMSAVRAATTIPITMSRAANTESHFKDERRASLFTDYADFEDMHVYTQSLIDWPSMLKWRLSQWYGQRLTIYGEFGASMSLSSSDRAARYQSMKNVLAVDPYAIGAFAWAMTDTGDGTVPTTNMGLFSHPTAFDGSERTEMTDVFKTFPVTE